MSNVKIQMSKVASSHEPEGPVPLVATTTLMKEKGRAIMQAKNHFLLFGGMVLVVSLLISSSVALATPYNLAETIDMTGYDILNIGSDGSNLLILNNGSPDTVKTVDLSGSLINSFDTPSNFNSGITYNGSMIVFDNGLNVYNTYLREVDPLTGSTSVPLSPNLGPSVVKGLGFDGSNILVSYNATGAAGILTSVITKLDATTYTNVGTMSVTVDTGTNIAGTPTYGVAWHNDNLFLSLLGVDKVYQFDAGLNLIEEIPIITDWPRGIAFVGNDLFVADRGAREIYRYTPIPEPASMVLLGSGLLGMLGLGWRKKGEFWGHHTGF